LGGRDADFRDNRVFGRASQDGRAHFHVEGRGADFAFSTIDLAYSAIYEKELNLAIEINLTTYSIVLNSVIISLLASFSCVFFMGPLRSGSATQVYVMTIGRDGFSAKPSNA
jgi:hypothetical protein